jgi:hypothetical protein
MAFVLLAAMTQTGSTAWIVLSIVPMRDDPGRAASSPPGLSTPG